jgi:hypothetical protein
MLTLFVTAMNKATGAFDGWMGSISKIGMILALFRVAKAVFKKFSIKLEQYFMSTGEKIGEGIARGIKNKEDEALRAAEKLGERVGRAATPKTETAAT